MNMPHFQKKGISGKTKSALWVSLILIAMSLLGLQSCDEAPGGNRVMLARLPAGRVMLERITAGRAAGRVVDGPIVGSTLIARNPKTGEILVDADGNPYTAVTNEDGSYSFDFAVSSDPDSLNPVSVIIESADGVDIGADGSKGDADLPGMTLNTVVSITPPENINVTTVPDQSQVSVTPVTSLMASNLIQSPDSSLEDVQKKTQTQTGLSVTELTSDPTQNANAAQVASSLAMVARLTEEITKDANNTSQMPSKEIFKLFASSGAALFETSDTGGVTLQTGIIVSALQNTAGLTGQSQNKAVAIVNASADVIPFLAQQAANQVGTSDDRTKNRAVAVLDVGIKNLMSTAELLKSNNDFTEGNQLEVVTKTLMRAAEKQTNTIYNRPLDSFDKPLDTTTVDSQVSGAQLDTIVQVSKSASSDSNSFLAKASGKFTSDQVNALTECMTEMSASGKNPEEIMKMLEVSGDLIEKQLADMTVPGNISSSAVAKTVGKSICDFIKSFDLNSSSFTQLVSEAKSGTGDLFDNSKDIANQTVSVVVTSIQSLQTSNASASDVLKNSAALDQMSNTINLVAQLQEKGDLTKRIDSATMNSVVQTTQTNLISKVQDSLLPDIASTNVAFTNTAALSNPAGMEVSTISGKVTETGSTTTFTVVLKSAPTADVDIPVVSFDTSEGTVAPSSLKFTASNWNVPQTVTVTGANDFLHDGNQIFQVRVGSAVSTDANYNRYPATTVNVTNIDDETPGFLVGKISGNTTEIGGTATFGVRLASQPNSDVVVAVKSMDTTEGTALPASLKFTVANWDTIQMVTVTGVNDYIADGNINYPIALDKAVSGDNDYNLLDPEDVAVINVDDEIAGFIVSSMSGSAMTVSAVSGKVTEGGATATFSIVLKSEPYADVTIPIASLDISEGTVSPSSLTFTASNWNAPQTVTIKGINDFLHDGNQLFQIKVGPTVSTDVNYNSNPATAVNVTNIDDETPGFLVGTVSGSTTEASGTATFGVSLASQPVSDVVIAVKSFDLTEGTALPASLKFTVDNWNAIQIVTVTGVDDNLADGNIPYKIVLDKAVSADNDYNLLDPPDVDVINVDNETAGVLVSTISGITTEAGGTATFTVKLTSEPTADVSMALTSSDTTEGSLSTTTLTFTAANWNADQTVTVTGVDDFIIDGNQTYTIALAKTVSTDANYNGLAPAGVSVINTDNETAGFVVSDLIGNVTEAGGTGNFVVKLTSQPTADVTLTVTSSNLLEATVTPGTLTFGATTWNIAQSVTITGVDDIVADGNQPVTIALSQATSADANYNGIDPVDVTTTVTDDETPGFIVSAISGNTTEAGGTATFTVMLQSKPAGNISIGITSSAIDEGTVSPPGMTFLTSNWNTPQMVTVTGVDDAIADGNQNFSIFLDNTASVGTYIGVEPNDVTVINEDDESVGVTVSALTGTGTSESGSKQEHFTIVLNSAPIADVTINIHSSDPTEVITYPYVTFTPANWNIPQNVDLYGVDDELLDGPQNVTVFMEPTVSTDPAYNGIDPADISLINDDDDQGQVSAGATHTCATDGTGVSCWGSGSNGNLGNGTNGGSNMPVNVIGLTDTLQVSSGFDFTCALKKDGTVVCWGIDSFGQLGDGGNLDQWSPVQVTGISTAVQVSSGNDHACAVLNDGSVRCWGRNHHGQLGNNSLIDSNTPVAVQGIIDVVEISAGGAHTCALTSDQSVACWGQGGSGQLGDGKNLDQPLPVWVANLQGPMHVSAGDIHSCALLGSGEIRCWGDNTLGQMGNGTVTSSNVPVSTMSLPSVRLIDAGFDFTCANLYDRNVQCWGSGTSGQLGIGANTDKNSPSALTINNIMQLDLGQYHACAVDGAKNLWCWGSNTMGQLGTGDITDHNTPVMVNFGSGGGTCTTNCTCTSNCGGGPEQFGTAYQEIVHDVSMDQDGVMYVVGSTTGDLDGPGAGGSDAFIVQYSSSGTKQWSRTFGTSGEDVAYAVATNTAGDVFVVGSVGGSLDGNTYEGGLDIVLVKYDWNGNRQWSKQIGIIGDDEAYDIALDPDGSIYVAGYTSGSLAGNSSYGNTDAVLLKFNSATDLQWAEQIGTSASDLATGVALDHTGMVLISGNTGGSLGGSNAGGTDVFVVRYDHLGRRGWMRQMGSMYSDTATAMAADNDNVFVTGYTDGSIGGNSNSGSYDAFVMAFNAFDGMDKWTTMLGESGWDEAHDIAIDPANHALYITGFTQGSLFGGTPMGNNDLFLVRYDYTDYFASIVWGIQNGTSVDDSGSALALSPKNEVIIAGHTDGDFEGNTNQGMSDGLIVRIGAQDLALNAVYRFQGDANDYGKNHLDGTVFNATLTTGPGGDPNSAYSFNGTDSYISFPHDASLNLGPGSLTISMWLKADSFPGTGSSGIISKSDYDGSTIFDSYSLSVDSSGYLTVSVRDSDSATPDSMTSYSVLTLNTWTKIDIVIDVIDMTLYINGIYETNASFVNADTTVNPSSNLILGALQNTSGIPELFFNGVVTSLLIHGRALSDDEVYQYYRSDSDHDIPAIVNSAPMDNAVNVPVDSIISVEFDEALDVTSINSNSFRIIRNSNGSMVPGRFAYDATTNTVFFLTESLLDAGAAYTITLYPGIRDVVGNSLGGQYTRTFTTQGNNTWTTIATMSESRCSPAGGVLDGQIYVVGGVDASNYYLNSMEIFDPEYDTWSSGYNMPTPRKGAAHAVVGGKLYVIGGETTGGTPTNSVEAFNPDAYAWETKANIPDARVGMSAQVFNNKIYVVGGYPTGVSYVYDPVLNTWSALMAIPTGSYYAGSAVDGNNIFIFGGDDFAGNYSNGIRTYNPVMDTWGVSSSSPNVRAYQSAGKMFNRLFMVGGSTAPGVRSSAFEWYAFDGTWIPKANLPAARDQGVAVVLDDRKVFYIGGSDGTNCQNSVYSYNP
ncbi:MAG: Ig-like domain-containing protein [SAR324 cluster bacterium]|nr:Ig-like domain-containing protein [SAR324 cluster bacterium]